MPRVKSARVAEELSTIHSKLFMIYVMMTQGRYALIDMDVFKGTLNELEELYADAVPEW